MKMGKREGMGVFSSFKKRLRINVLGSRQRTILFGFYNFMLGLGGFGAGFRSFDFHFEWTFVLCCLMISGGGGCAATGGIGDSCVGHFIGCFTGRLTSRIRRHIANV